MQRQYRRTLKAQIIPSLVGDLLHQALEGQLRDKECCTMNRQTENVKQCAISERSNSPVHFWYLRISRKATVPGRKRCIFRRRVGAAARAAFVARTFRGCLVLFFDRPMAWMGGWSEGCFVVNKLVSKGWCRLSEKETKFCVKTVSDVDNQFKNMNSTE